MRQVTLKIPELMFVVGTRVMIGVGVGLLAAEKLRERPRKAIAATLILIGAVSTVPVILTLRSRLQAGELPEPALQG